MRKADDKMFTRDITTTTVTAKVINVNADNTTEKVFVLPFETDDKEKAKSFLRKYRETESEIIVSVVKVETVHKMYGMTLETFLANAVELDPITRKPIENK